MGGKTCGYSKILETQSCNVNAIDFYLHEGFTLIGMDTCCYNNNDLQMEITDDWYNVELMTMHAFWNKYHLGCDEHYFYDIMN